MCAAVDARKAVGDDGNREIHKNIKVTVVKCVLSNLSNQLRYYR